MSRRRYLSTDISLDLRINRLAAAAGDFAVMLYTWMIPHAADDASLPADPEEIMYMVIPGRRDKTTEDVAAALGAMRDCGLIIWQGGELRFPAAAFYRYQTYIKEGNRRGANQQETPQDSENSANQRKSAQNAVSPSLSPPISPPPSVKEPSAPSAAVSEPPTIANITELTEERPHEMVAAFCASIGADVATQAPAWVGKQRAVAKRLIEQGYTVAKVVACAGFRQSQVWRDEPFDLFDIEKGIGKWEAAGAPPRAKGRASPNGHSSNGRGPITTSDKFLVNGKEPDDEQRKRYDEADRLAFERAKARQAEAGL